MNPLIQLAHDDLVMHMQRYGNKLSVKHTDALKAVLTYYTEIASGELSGRYAFPLGTSTGKTQSIASWCYAVHSLDLPYTLMACQEQIDTLSDLYLDLIGRGIPADQIGIIHTDKTAKIQPSTGNPWDYKFLLITHEMIKVTADLDQYMVTADPESFNAVMESHKHRRSLVAWDESLIKSDSRHIVGSQLQGALGWLKDATSGVFAERSSETLKDAIAYLQDALKVIARVHTRNVNGRIPALPECDAETIGKYKAALRGVKSLQKDTRAPLMALLENSQESLRIVNLSRGTTGEGLITYDLRIPASLDNVVILDASAVIRELQDMDTSIEIVSGYEDIKSHENLHVLQTLCRGGNGFIRTIRRNDPLINEVVNDVTSDWLPADQAVIITACKSRNGKAGPLDKIRSRLKEVLGDDFEKETIMVHIPKGNAPDEFHEKPKYVFLNWGREKATNQYRYCSRMIAVGVLRRDVLELSAAAAGQQEDLSADIVTSIKDIERIQTSEQFYRLQQWLGRGTARKTEYGVCAPCYAKVYDQANFSDYLGRGLPGVDWSTQDNGVFVKAANKGPRTNTKQSKLSLQITEWMASSSPDEILVADLRSQPMFQAIAVATFRRGLNAALKAGMGYERKGLKLIRSIT